MKEKTLRALNLGFGVCLKRLMMPIGSWCCKDVNAGYTVWNNLLCNFQDMGFRLKHLGLI